MVAHLHFGRFFAPKVKVHVFIYITNRIMNYEWNCYFTLWKSSQIFPEFSIEEIQVIASTFVWYDGRFITENLENEHVGTIQRWRSSRLVATKQIPLQDHFGSFFGLPICLKLLFQHTEIDFSDIIRECKNYVAIMKFPDEPLGHTLLNCLERKK